jgi:hypothetical protein
VCRRYGISETTFCRWKADFGGVAVNDTKRLRQIEAKNSQRKRLLALGGGASDPNFGERPGRFEPLETVSLRCISGMANRPRRRSRVAIGE